MISGGFFFGICDSFCRNCVIAFAVLIALISCGGFIGMGGRCQTAAWAGSAELEERDAE